MFSFLCSGWVGVQPQLVLCIHTATFGTSGTNWHACRGSYCKSSLAVPRTNCRLCYVKKSCFFLSVSSTGHNFWIGYCVLNHFPFLSGHSIVTFLCLESLPGMSWSIRALRHSILCSMAFGLKDVSSGGYQDAHAWCQFVRFIFSTCIRVVLPEWVEILAK